MIPVSDLSVGWPIGLLVIGALVLLAAMAMMSVSLPQVRWHPWRHRHRRRFVSKPRRHRRRAVTGRPPSMSAAGGPPRQVASAPDIPDSMIDVRGAEQVIEHYLDRDPRALASVISAWLAADDPESTGVTR